MRILFLDIETSPNECFTWGIWQQNISLGQMITSSRTLCWSAKFLGEKKIYFDSVHKSSTKKMLRGIHTLLSEADTAVTYNGKKFDIPTLNKEFLLHGFNPPAPYKQIDILQVVRGAFRFQSNKLDSVATHLKLGKKTPHEGFTLWVKCMNGDPVAWKRMEKYNRNDVVLLENVYKKVLPWIKTHPSHSTHTGLPVCPKCGGNKYQSRGTVRNAQGMHRRYQCACGGWMRGPTIKHSKPVERMVSL